tara:strand:- start:374 stop:637 length:264 start_codon:yes stop_codon:yes gene_type:complete
VKNNQLEILLKIVNENLEKDGIGKSHRLEIKNNQVYAFWGDSCFLVGHLLESNDKLIDRFFYKLVFGGNLEIQSNSRKPLQSNTSGS